MNLTNTRRVGLSLVVLALAAAGCGDQTTGITPGDLLDRELGAKVTMVPIVPVPRNGEGPSTMLAPKATPNPGILEDRNFHEDLTSTNWVGTHQGSGANNSKYIRNDNGKKYEHISDSEYGPHASKYKPDGTSHIEAGEWASRYQ